MKILILNGPNLNFLGVRDQKYYGKTTLDGINTLLKKTAEPHGVSLLFFQSNHEGALIDCIQKYHGKIEGILINPGALSHYSYALHDAIVDAKVPTIEVHLSNIFKRDEFRKQTVLRDTVLNIIVGGKEKSYTKGLLELIRHIKRTI